MSATLDARKNCVKSPVPGSLCGENDVICDGAHIGRLIGQDLKRGGTRFIQDCTPGLSISIHYLGLRPEVKYLFVNIKEDNI